MIPIFLKINMRFFIPLCIGILCFLARVKASSFCVKLKGKCFQHPIPSFVSTGQSRFGNGLPKTQMVKCRVFGVQAFDDFEWTLAPNQMGDGHANQLLAHCHISRPCVAIEVCGQLLAKVLLSIKSKACEKIKCLARVIENKQLPFQKNKCATLVFPLFSMINNMISKIRTSLTEHRCPAL